MTIIHAFRRTRPHTVDLFGQLFKFAANDAGHQVCNVEHPKAAARLLEIKDAYRAYGDEMVPEADDGGEEDASPYIITDGDQTIDLRELSDEQLHAFAKENEIKVHPSAKGDTVRDKIVAALNSVV